MRFKNIYILLFVSIFLNEFAFAQQIEVKKDSTQLYKNIETYSKQRKFTKFIYGLIFKSIPTKSSGKGKKKAILKVNQRPYSAFEGKVIRHINIVTLDPFGFSINDTSRTAENILFKVGNGLHVKSQHITIRNLLLIHRNQVFDSLLVKESERLVRSRGFVGNVSFSVFTVSNHSDSVDVYIREIDNWSIIPKAIISTSRNTIDLTDRNFMGLGHEFQHRFSRNFSSGINSYVTSYSIPNIRNTYVSTSLKFEVDGYHNFYKSLEVDRPFYSPYAKWAGGAFLATQFKKDSLKVINSPYVPLNLKFDTQDFWLGKAFRISKGNTEKERTTNLIVTARYLRVRYWDKPPVIYDRLNIYSTEDFYLAGIGISNRRYVRDQYVYNYGIIEDVPVGKVYALTGGYQIKNNIIRRYLGLRYAYGNYNEWGYLSANFEFGTFFHASKAEQGTISGGINYFTPLIEIGKWKFRQFVKPQVTIGINRYYNDSLTLKDGYGLDGFNSSALSGNSRLMFSLQTQSYAPWDWIGFHFGPYFICSFGMLGDGAKGFKNSKIYSQFGVGVLVKNVNLIFSTFEFSISFYPSIPGNGSNIIKMNSFNTADFGLRDFEIGKPAIVLFQ